MASNSNNADDADGGAAELVWDGRVQVRICCYDFAMEQKSFRFPRWITKSAEHLRDLVEQRMIAHCEIGILCGHGLGDFDQGMQQEDISVDDVFGFSPWCAKNFLLYTPKEFEYIYIRSPTLHHLGGGEGVVAQLLLSVVEVRRGPEVALPLIIGQGSYVVCIWVLRPVTRRAKKAVPCDIDRLQGRPTSPLLVTSTDHKESQNISSL